MQEYVKVSLEQARAIDKSKLFFKDPRNGQIVKASTIIKGIDFFKKQEWNEVNDCHIKKHDIVVFKKIGYDSFIERYSTSSAFPENIEILVRNKKPILVRDVTANGKLSTNYGMFYYDVFEKLDVYVNKDYFSNISSVDFAPGDIVEVTKSFSLLEDGCPVLLSDREIQIINDNVGRYSQVQYCAISSGTVKLSRFSAPYHILKKLCGAQENKKRAEHNFAKGDRVRFVKNLRFGHVEDFKEYSYYPHIDNSVDLVNRPHINTILKVDNVYDHYLKCISDAGFYYRLSHLSLEKVDVQGDQ